MSRTHKPPPLPSETLARVIRLASVDGRMVLWLSGCCAFFSAAGHDAIGAIVGCAAAGAGAMELHGAIRLRRADLLGLTWVIRAQLLLLFAILVYSALSVSSFDTEFLRAHIGDFKSNIDQLGITQEQFIEYMRQARILFYLIVSVVSVFYQGGMIRYYARRRGAIEQALNDESSMA